ncbi:hypothetical protein [Chryseobacterium sp. ERMR1:04]|uniref:hypothetical protein n=1 Tax=Chryseobacterium sp. ERMR1:04 TaxID=1705393 RepID=UPI0006C8789D|nr:hypothetical protein [Chryseobacterium sp. ERMR1:04]
MENEKNNEEKLNPLIWLFIVILILWIISVVLVNLIFTTWTERGTFGDSFGALNSLFSGLAFGGIIYTILLQRKELKLQRDELILTRDELKRSANAQEESNKFQHEQIRIANLPIFQYETEIHNNVNYLIIKNESGRIAFDVDIWHYITYFEEDIIKKDFIEGYVKNISKKHLNLNLWDDEIWSISERGIYASFPNNYSIKIPIESPLDINIFDIFIQYRDSLNNNYALRILFDRSFSSNEVPFIIGEFEPKILTLFDRIDLTDVALKRETIHEIFKPVYDIHQSSIFVNHLKNKITFGVESRWHLKKINSY